MDESRWYEKRGDDESRWYWYEKRGDDEWGVNEQRIWSERRHCGAEKKCVGEATLLGVTVTVTVTVTVHVNVPKIDEW